jgi:ribosome biogenesis protein SSF1/2
LPLSSLLGPFLCALASQLVLSNFNPAPGEAPKPQLKLMSTMFQGMFPPIQIDKVRLLS